MELLYILASIAALASASPLSHSSNSDSSSSNNNNIIPDLASRQDKLCNGQAAFCSRKYTNVSLIGSHNAPFVGSILDPRVNQEVDVTGQLNAGIRFLTGQTHMGNAVEAALGDVTGGLESVGNSIPDASPGVQAMQKRDQELHMCHTSCVELDAGSLAAFLSTIKTWLDGNPNEVVTLLLANGDNTDVALFGDVFAALPGMVQYAFVPATSPDRLALDAWPTYGELIAAGKRLVVFLDYGADPNKVDYILDEFTYFFETPFTQTDPNYWKSCSSDRSGTIDAADTMYLVNHVLDTQLLPNIDIPDNADDARTNAATGDGSIGAHADVCIAQYGHAPNVMVVDMFDRGDVFTAQRSLNGL